MTDTPSQAPVVAPQIPAAAKNGQLIVALAIVAVMGSIAMGLIIAGVITGQWAVLSGGIGTAIGALATALNAPTGIANALAAAGKGDA